LWAVVETLATCCCNLHVAINSDEKWETLNIYLYSSFLFNFFKIKQSNFTENKRIERCHWQIKRIKRCHWQIKRIKRCQTERAAPRGRAYRAPLPGERAAHGLAVW